MLYVVGQVGTEEAAKSYPLPREIDDKTWQWPHGLTAPMHNVRKRRFRKRVSHRTIEAAEEEVERLIAMDEKGTSTYEILDLDAMRNQEAESDEYEYEYEDETGQLEVDENGMAYEFAAQEEDEDPEAMAARMALELGGEDESELPTEIVEEQSTILPPAQSQGTSPAAEATSPAVEADEGLFGSADDDEEEAGGSDDDEDEEEDEENENNREQAQYLTEQREEIEHLEREIQSAKEQLATQVNSMLRSRIAKRIESLQNDLNVKKQGLGIGEEDDA